MTTSFTRTRTQVIARVLSKVIKIGGATAATADSDVVSEALDLRLKSMHKLGIFWRKVTTVPVSFSLGAGIVSASAGAGDILFPLSITFTGSEDEPVQIIGPREYAAIPDKARAGQPEKALWDGGTKFTLYPVPTSDGTAKLLYEKIADDTTAGAAVDVDVSMILPLMDIVKYDVADDFGIDEQTQVRWRAEARQAELAIRRLGALRVGLTDVAVDNWHDRESTESDYGR